MKIHQIIKSLIPLFSFLMVSSSYAQIQSSQWSGLVGFANYNDMRNGITGGYGGEVVRVSNRADFTTYVGDNIPRVVILEGRLEGTGVDREKDIISVGSNKTIVGAGSGATLYGIGLDINTKENIIIRNLTIFDADPDAIACRNAHHIWVDHCDLSSEHDNTKEDWDGLLDFTIGSSYLTASWNKFHDHDKVSVCNSGTMHYEDNGKIRLTYHHNSFISTTQRNPRVGYGLGHVFNNYYEDISSYCIGTHTQAKVMSENNYFSSNANNPFQQMYSAVPYDASYGEIGESGSYFSTSIGSSVLNQPTGTTFIPAAYYSYDKVLDNATTVKDIIANNAGPKEGIEKEAILWPGNGAIDISCDARLLWGPLENVSKTLVYVGKDPDNLVYDESASSIGATPGQIQLDENTTYYWRVKTVFNDDSEYETPLYCFTTADNKASKPYPVDGETNAQLREAVAEKSSCGPMTLKWRPAFDAKEYNVYISEPDGDSPVHFLGTTTSTSLKPDYLRFGSKYVWRVDVVKSDESVVTGDEWSFSSPTVFVNEGKTEAEDLIRNAYVYKEYSDGSWYVSSNNYATVGEAGPGSLNGIWNGPDGKCTMSLTYWNETSGAAGFYLFVNDEQIETWRGDKQSYAMVTHTAAQQVTLKKGDLVRADFYVDGKMRCRIDYLNITVDEISSGISESLADTSDEKPAPIYDLMGRKVNVLQPGRIYICKGKKFVSK
ncbi:MAG: polysaccharide lyase family 1 protein [Prevotella sp.]